MVWLKEGIEVEKTQKKWQFVLGQELQRKKIKKVGSFSEVWKMVWLKEGIEVKKKQKKWQLDSGLAL